MSDVTTSTNRFAGSSIQKVALLVGVVFLLVGIAGFVPGLTTGDLGGAGHGSMAMLLGLFQVSVLHNIVHLLFGVVGVLAAGHASGANFVPLNWADNWLHLVLAVGMVALGVVFPRERPRPVGA